jgi:hypothetical protein
MKDVNQRYKKSGKTVQSESTNLKIQQSELENLFFDCVEEVRKEVMRRRLKSEVQTRKNFVKGGEDH